MTADILREAAAKMRESLAVARGLLGTPSYYKRAIWRGRPVRFENRGPPHRPEAHAEWRRRMTADTCWRGVQRGEEYGPCDRPVSGLAFDPEGQGYDGEGFYPACKRHRFHDMPFLRLHRPDVDGIGRTAMAALAVMSA